MSLAPDLDEPQKPPLLASLPLRRVNPRIETDVGSALPIDDAHHSRWTAVELPLSDRGEAGADTSGLALLAA
jgi:hypothetical protein